LAATRMMASERSRLAIEWLSPTAPRSAVCQRGQRDPHHEGNRRSACFEQQAGRKDTSARSMMMFDGKRDPCGTLTLVEADVFSIVRRQRDSSKIAPRVGRRDSRRSA
jgi:hypothetical protein